MARSIHRSTWFVLAAVLLALFGACTPKGDGSIRVSSFVEAKDGSRTATLDSVDVAGEQFALSLRLETADGLKFNEEAPQNWSISGTGLLQTGPPSETRNEANTVLEVSAPMQITADGPQVTVSFNVVYCEAEDESVCYFDRGEIVVPIAVRRGVEREAVSVVYELGVAK